MEPNTIYISKNDLEATDYCWDDNNNTNLVSPLREPNRLIFDRYNGSHMLYMINYYFQATGSYSQDIAVLVETMLRDRLPFGLNSEISAFNWLKQQVHPSK